MRVNYPEPTITLTAGSTLVSAGTRVTLTWTSTYATAVVRAENFNTTALNGSTYVYPTQTTTYGITMTGPGGTTTRTVTVTVTGT